MKHYHDYILYATEKYRDEDRREYLLEIYRCACGAGKTVPKHATLVGREDYAEL